MKKYIPLLLFIPLFMASCKNTWTQEDKDSFHEACLDDANTWAGSPDKAKTYCDCVMGKVIDKYPHVSDALEHINDLVNDPELKSCKATIKK